MVRPVLLPLVLALAGCAPRTADVPAPELRVTVHVVNDNPSSVQATVRDPRTGRWWRFQGKRHTIQVAYRDGPMVLVGTHEEARMGEHRPYVAEFGPVRPGECFVWTMGTWYGVNRIEPCPEG